MPKKKQESMPSYVPSQEERKWHLYCVRNDIRVSPGGANYDNWHIDVCLDGKTWHRSPKTFGKDEIWENCYKICRYYYDKQN